MSIRWINAHLGTGAYDRVPQGDYHIVDVRGLVDKDGNQTDTIRQEIDRIVASLKSGKKTVVCCDYGISRSNSLAAAAWAVFKKIPFDDALSQVVSATGEQDIKMEMISTVRRALEGEKTVDAGRILVTGAGGFLGRSLVPKLRKTAYVVPFSSSQGDLSRSGRELEALVVREKIGQIVHLANPKVYTSASAMGQSLNILKTVLDVCKQYRLKLVFPSTWEVFTGYNTESLTASENTPVLPKGAYAETKMLAEKLIGHFIDHYELRCLKLRMCPVYGTNSDKPRFIHTFIKKALLGEEIVTHTYQNGAPRLGLIHADDLTELFSETVSAGLEGCYHIGGGSFLSTTEVAQMIVKSLGSRSSIRTVQIDDFAPNIVLDDRKLFHLPAFHGRTKRPFEAGLPDLISLYTRNG